MTKKSGADQNFSLPFNSHRFLWDVSEQVPLLLSDGEHDFIYGVGSTPSLRKTASATSPTCIPTNWAR